MRRVRSIGTRDRPTSPRSPRQNGYAERLIGSIRRECIDHIVVVGERHLRHVLLSYKEFYNDTRTHLALNKDAPISRAVENAGRIICHPILGGLHHQYGRGPGKFDFLARFAVRRGDCHQELVPGYYHAFEGIN
jgi:hypothetical protein